MNLPHLYSQLLLENIWGWEKGLEVGWGRRLERTPQSGTELRWVLGMELPEGRPERTWAQSETLNLDLTVGEASRTQQNGTSVEVGLSCRKIKSYFLLP